MWQASFQTTTDVPAEDLYRAITDFNAWHKWDDGIEYTTLLGEAKIGGEFILKPKCWPAVKMTSEKMWLFEVIMLRICLSLKYAPSTNTNVLVTQRIFLWMCKFRLRWVFCGKK